MGAPKGWQDYPAMGSVIRGTRIVAFKTPLKPENYNTKSDDPALNRFSPQDCIKALNRISHGRARLGLVLNLTFTTKYYNPDDFQRSGVFYGAIMCPGHEIPNDDLYYQFERSIQSFYYDYPASPRGTRLVGVHCTHGVNRTGYMIARYLIQCERWPVEQAIEAVGSARGHPIERANYLAHLRNLHKPSYLFPKIPTEKDLRDKKDSPQDQPPAPGTENNTSDTADLVSEADVKSELEDKVDPDGGTNPDGATETNPDNDSSQSPERLRLKRPSGDLGPSEDLGLPSEDTDFIPLGAGVADTADDHNHRSIETNDHIQEQTSGRGRPHFKPTVPDQKRRKKV